MWSRNGHKARCNSVGNILDGALLIAARGTSDDKDVDQNDDDDDDDDGHYMVC
jgi:hypothetical protein